jgi:ABC-2 type transport system ATP-binding protein
VRPELVTRQGPALHLSNVCKSYGSQRVLEGVSLTLQPGEIYTLLGPNGAGKTTTLNLILGFTRADDGTIEVSGVNVAERPLEARSRTAYLPETVMLYPTLTAMENLTYFTLLSGRQLDAAQAKQLLATVGLQSGAHDQRTGSFSKGMRQKVGVAVALAKRASLLLLDEPTSGLDPRAADELSVMVRAAAENGMAVLMTTHDLQRTGELAHRLGIMNGGRLVTERDAASLSSESLEALYLEHFA